MVNHKVSLGVGLVLVLALVYWFLIYDTEERRIKRQFKQVSDLFTKAPEDTQLTLATRVGRLKFLVAEICQLDFTVYGHSGTYSADEIANHALAVLTEARQLELEFFDLSIQPDISSTARVSLTARLNWETASQGGLTDTHELECVLEKQEEVWRFVRVTIIDVLEK